MTSMNHIHHLSALIVMALALTFTGCTSDDPAAPPDDQQPQYAAADSPDQLMDNFVQAYEAMDLEGYGDILHEDFIFDPVDEGGHWGFPADWDKNTELLLTGNMFNGRDGQNPDGSLRDGIQSIRINSMVRQTAWVSPPPEETLFDADLHALFDAAIVFTLNGGDNTMSVYYDQVFYVRAVETKLKSAEGDTLYELVGHREIRSYRAGNEDNSWSVIKTLYNTDGK